MSAERLAVDQALAVVIREVVPNELRKELDFLRAIHKTFTSKGLQWCQECEIYEPAVQFCSCGEHGCLHYFCGHCGHLNCSQCVTASSCDQCNYLFCPDCKEKCCK